MTRCFSTLNIFTLFTVCLVLRHGITVPFDHKVNERFAGIQVSDTALAAYYLGLVLLYCFLIAGVYCGARAFGQPPVEPQRIRSGLKEGRLPAGLQPVRFLVLVACVLGVMVHVQPKTRVGPKEFLSGGLSAAEYRELRDDYGQATHYAASPVMRLASIARFGLLPMVIYTLFFMRAHGIIWRILFYVLLSAGIYIGLLSGQKSPAVFLLIGIGVAYYFQRRGTKVSAATPEAWVGAALVGLLLIPLLYHLQYPTMRYVDAVQAAWYRLTSEHSRSLQLYFEVYPRIHPHLMGASSSLINSILGLNVPVDDLPERFIPVYYLGPGYSNTWNAAFPGVAWADFGFAGIILESFAVGLLLQVYAAWFRGARKTALVMGVQVTLLMAATKLTEAALSASLLTFGLGSVFVAYALMNGQMYHKIVTISEGAPSEYSGCRS